MKLPIKQILSKNKKLYQIVDAEDRLLIKDINDLGFAMDICDKFNEQTYTTTEIFEFRNLLVQNAITEGTHFSATDLLIKFDNHFKINV